MSNFFVNKIKNITVGNPTAKAVLLVLADSADESGLCHSSMTVERLAEITEFDSRTVKRALSFLQREEAKFRLRRQTASRRSALIIELGDRESLSPKNEGVRKSLSFTAKVSECHCEETRKCQSVTFIGGESVTVSLSSSENSEKLPCESVTVLPSHLKNDDSANDEGVRVSPTKVSECHFQNSLIRNEPIKPSTQEFNSSLEELNDNEKIVADSATGAKDKNPVKLSAVTAAHRKPRKPQKPRKPKIPPDPRCEAPVIQLIRGLTLKYPPKASWQFLIERTGNRLDDTPEGRANRQMLTESFSNWSTVSTNYTNYNAWLFQPLMLGKAFVPEERRPVNGVNSNNYANGRHTRQPDFAAKIERGELDHLKPAIQIGEP